MPINLIDYTNTEEGQKGKSLGDICKGEWEISMQIEALEVWLRENSSKLPKGNYVADIGFSPREGALGGGAILSTESMGLMVSIGMNLYLSEYPSDDE